MKQRVAELLYGKRRQRNERNNHYSYYMRNASCALLYEQEQVKDGAIMEALFKAINDILKEKDESISLLKWENGRLKEENAELKQENAELKQDIEKYKENEVNRV